jgi:hypothetical protein
LEHLFAALLGKADGARVEGSGNVGGGINFAAPDALRKLRMVALPFV